MPPEELAKENRLWDHDYALSWIRREGSGRVFYTAHGHREQVYAMRPFLAHLLAGIQYAIGDSPNTEPLLKVVCCKAVTKSQRPRISPRSSLSVAANVQAFGRLPWFAPFFLRARRLRPVFPIPKPP